jgi:hypothetical protein
MAGDAPTVRISLASAAREGSGRAAIRVLWGQSLLDDLEAGRYRTIVCGVNDSDNSQGVLGEILRLVPGSQWTVASATSYARVFRDAVSLHAKGDREPYVLKFDLDRLLVLGLLRPAGRHHFTLADLETGFATVRTMLEGRRDRQPVATVSFLGAKSNPVREAGGATPSLESVLAALHRAGFEGDFYPPLSAAGEGVMRARYP